MVRGTVVCVVALVAARVASAEANDDGTPSGGEIAVLAGGGGGLSGLGSIPGPLLELHAGAGWRARRWMVAGLASYSYTRAKALLADWSITRNDLAFVSVVSVQPFSRSGLGVHTQVGIGAAFDRLTGVGEGTTARAVSASIGAGIAWAPVALTFRYVIPEPTVCSARCYRGGDQAQLLVSLTFDAL